MRCNVALPLFNRRQQRATDPLAKNTARLTGGEIGERFLQLIEHLEQHIEAQLQWICTSHRDLHFFDQDLKRFAGFGDSPYWTLGMQARPVGFTVFAHAHPPWVSDAVLAENPESTEEAATLIANVLKKRGNWVEMR